MRLAQSSKTYIPILDTLLGITTEVRLAQLLNASSPISVTLSGIVIKVRLVQFAKASVSIIVTYFFVNRLAYIRINAYLCRVVVILYILFDETTENCNQRD